MATVIAGLTSRSGTGLDLYLSSTSTGTTRHFTSVSQLLNEVANARIWAGLALAVLHDRPASGSAKPWPESS